MTGRTRQNYGGSRHAGMGEGQRAMAQNLRSLQGSAAEGSCACIHQLMYVYYVYVCVCVSRNH
jgi:hypothetical protein